MHHGACFNLPILKRASTWYIAIGMPQPEIIGGRYEIRGLVGRGGMGVIYKAFDKVVGREVAIKTMGDIQGQPAPPQYR
jgi:hypothetical protein